MQWSHNSFQTGTLTQGKWPDRPLDEGDVCGAGEGCECSRLRVLMQGQEEARWGCSMQGQWGGGADKGKVTSQDSIAGGPEKEPRSAPGQGDLGSKATLLLQLTPCLTQQRTAKKPAPMGPGHLSQARVSPHPTLRLGVLSSCGAAGGGL